MKDDVTRPMPHAVGPEKSIISSIFQEPAEMMPQAVENGITAEMFYGAGRRVVFELLQELYTQGQDIELVTFRETLNKRGLIDRAGGESSLVDLYTYMPSPAHFDTHCEKVRDAYLLRRIIHLGASSVEVAHDAETSAEAMEALEREMTALTYECSTGCEVLPMPKILQDSIDAFEGRVRGTQDAQGIDTLSEIDEKLKGLHPGRLWVIGAYPGGGKSVIASQIMADMAIAGHPCLFLSLEMPEKDVVDRMVIQAARIDAAAYTDPQAYCKQNGMDGISVGILKRVSGSVRNLQESALRVHKPANRKLATIISAIRRAHREMGIKAAAVDYVQIIRSTSTQRRGLGLNLSCRCRWGAHPLSPPHRWPMKKIGRQVNRSLTKLWWTLLPKGG